MEIKKRLLIIGISEKVHTSDRLIREARRNDLPYDFIKWGSLVFLGGEIFSQSQKVEIKNYAAIFCDIPSYKLNGKSQDFYFRLYNELNEVCKAAEKHGVKLLNGKFLLRNPFYNKFAQAQMFAEKNVEAIETLHLCDNKLSKVVRVIDSLGWGYPLVVKCSEGGMGQAVWKAQDVEGLQDIIEDKRNQSLVYQPFVKNDCDFRVLVIGGKVLGIMKRTAKDGEWKNNFALGGSVVAFEDEKMDIFCKDVCRKLELEYVGLDVFKVGEGYKIIETNIFACFEGFEEAFPHENVALQILRALELVN